LPAADLLGDGRAPAHLDVCKGKLGGVRAGPGARPVVDQLLGAVPRGDQEGFWISGGVEGGAVRPQFSREPWRARLPERSPRLAAKPETTLARGTGQNSASPAPAA